MANGFLPSICHVDNYHPTDNYRLICGIDPGLASGGLVVINTADKNRVLASRSLVEKPGEAKKARSTAEAGASGIGGWGDMQFTAAALRSESWCLKVRQALDEICEEYGSIEFFAVESFVDQPSRARKEKAGLLRNRWQTPLSIGGLAAVLREHRADVANGRVVYQNAGIVIPQWQTQIAQLEKRTKGKDAGVAPDDRLVGNDHERKALVHALALALRVGNGNSPTNKENTSTFEGRHE